MKRFAKNFEWVFAILRLNWANVTAHKGAFWSLTVMMCLQNLIYFMMWVFVFDRVGTLRGWGLREVAFLYGAGALGYGILFTLFGGLNRIAYMIEDGDLDTYLARPRSTIWLTLLSRMRADSIGDILCGVVMLAIFVRPDAVDLPLLAILSLSAGLVYMAVRLICHCLSFWGFGGDAGEYGFMAFLISSTNPTNGFGMFAKIALFTIWPAGFISLLPVEILRDFRWDYLALQLAGSVAIFAFSLWLFERGLKRYRSGNKFLLLR